jgi:Lon protease-like protein
MMPMFPLGTVLLPGGVLPLHVFEPRYRAMVRDCLAGEREFGVVLITRGTEVGGGDQRSMVGSVARMVQVAELADGRYAMITVGMRRIRINRWLLDDPYPRADVEVWPDATVPGSVDLAPVTAHVRRLSALAIELGDDAGDPAQELSEDPELASFQLAALAPLGPADRQALLCAPNVSSRLSLLSSILIDVEAALTFRLANEGS